MAQIQGESLGEIERSSVQVATRPTGRWIDGAPVYEYVRAPGAPPVHVMRFSSHEVPVAHAHAHDFLVLAYFERGGGSVRLDDRRWPVRSGDAFVIAPGEVVRVDEQDHAVDAAGWCVFFPAGL